MFFYCEMVRTIVILMPVSQYIYNSSLYAVIIHYSNCTQLKKKNPVADLLTERKSNL